MNREQIRRLLQQVAQGTLEVGAAETELTAAMRTAAMEDLDFAKVDHQRQLRCGFPEVIFGEGKTPEQLAAIFATVASKGHGCLATRVDDEQVRIVRESFPDSEYDETGRTLWHGPIAEPAGQVLVLTAGTSDLPVAREAYVTVKAMGCNVELIVDVGVAGLHRLLRHEAKLNAADCIVVAAGMEGALPSVVGGLTDCPVIAVPTSIGYGASFDGIAALLGMLSSCASNVAVVNIDGGFCGGYVAALIARRAAGALGNSPPRKQERPEP